MRIAPVIATCAVLVCACGDSTAKPTESATKPASNSTAHVDAANRVCVSAQPAMDRTGEAINRAGKAGSRSQRLEASRKAWLAQYRTMSDTFKRLRAAKDAGADKRYDSFIYHWGNLLATIESVAEHTGGDQEQLETSYGALTVYAEDLRQAALAAGVERCSAPFAREGDVSKG